MRELTKLRHKIDHFHTALSGFKYLKLLYVAAFAVGLTASVYIQNQSTNMKSEASSPIYKWTCKRESYGKDDCKLYMTRVDVYPETINNPAGTCVTLNEPLTSGEKSFKFINCHDPICIRNCESLTPSPTPPNSPTPLPTAVPSATTPPTNTPTSYQCGGSRPSNTIRFDAEETWNVPQGLTWKYSSLDTTRKCEYSCQANYTWNGSSCVGLGSGATATPAPSATPTRSATNTPRPTATPTPVLGNKGCGIQCNSTAECQSGFDCRDITNNTVGNECWNEGICGGPALKSRVEGVVRGCNNEPLQNVPVWAWGNTDYTDQNGKFQLNKGISRNSEGDITLNETTIKAGNDATFNTTTGLGYFDNGTGRQYDALQLRSGNSCGLVNCLFSNRVGDGLNIGDSHKLMAGGPARTAYRLGRRSSVPDQGLTDALFEYNFVFTDYHAKSFNFKKIGCPTVPPPTLTPPPLYTCNQTCTLNSQCETTNSNWFCAQTYNFDTSGWVEETGYFNPSGQGKITGLNLHLTSDGKIAEHIVKGGRIYYRPEFNAAISDVTHNVNAAGCASQPNITVDACTALAGTIIDFNSYLHILRIDGVDRSVTEQHVIRKKSNGEVNLYSRDVIHGVEDWTQPWNLNTYFSTNLITGSKDNVTAFTSFFQNVDDFRIQNVVGGGVVFQRAMGIYGWGNSMAQFTWCTNNGLCGYNPNGTGNPILAFEQVEWSNGNISRYIVRKDGRVYKNVGYRLDQKCRIKNHMWNYSSGPYTCN